MKNIISTILVLIVTIVLVGCSSTPKLHEGQKTISIVTENPDRAFFQRKIAEFNIIKTYQLTDVEFLDLMQQGIELYKFALVNKMLWNSEELYNLKGELRKAQRSYYDRKGTLEFNVLLQKAAACPSAQGKIAAYDKAIELLQSAEQKAIWTTSEKNGFKQLITNVAKQKAAVEDSYNKLLAAATTLLENQRFNYVFKHGKYDLATASRYFNENNNKYLNWWIFGYLRNDMNIIRKAWSLCARVGESEYTIMSLKCQAKEIVIKLNKITTSSQQRTFIDYPVQYYPQDRKYPNWEPRQKAEQDFIRSNKTQKFNPERTAPLCFISSAG